MNAETRDATATYVEEHRRVLWTFESGTEKTPQDVDRVCPKRAEPDLAAFSKKPHRGRGGVEMEISDVGLCRFAGTSPRVVQEKQQAN